MTTLPELEKIKRCTMPFRELNRVLFQLRTLDADRVGITPQQLMVLNEVRNNPGIGLDQLSEHVQLASSTLSGIVDRLVKSDLLRRERSTRDRRQLELHLSPSGLEKLQEAYDPEKSVLLQRMAVALEMPAQDIETMIRIQNQFLARLRGTEELERT
ncbi:MarR family winged helix-turn-helix transcriptional regulator [Tumebacillus permanentifrigoris]|uniref:DNA-binding MarR family transcriptional regulator n=1 Tax=Tumebacillus permanentifrigoris TaxID=378543 RepID=A0A316DCE1_9BACL|nr:MarR family transcriptional regulator [Tumebacillus permanentifrigoris]PWK15817.1 DNA-binding MarR family transcriptional regulator [Tumebacillus permanentifrigoris]